VEESYLDWTDESSFSTAGFGHRPWVIRKADKEHHPDCVDLKFHSGRKSEMILGAFCGTTKSDLIFVPGRAKLDSATHVRMVLEAALVAFWRQCCEEYDGLLCKRITLQGIKGMPKPPES